MNERKNSPILSKNWMNDLQTMNSLFRPTTSYRGKPNEFFARWVARCLVLVALWPSLFLPALASSSLSGSGLKLSSRTTSFGYDGLDRLKQITADDGQAWNYDYDEVGNKSSLTRPNGTQTGYAYDQLNRLTDMATRQGTADQVAAGTAPLVSRFDYHLRADGRRDGLSEQVVQPDGTTSTRTVAYAFDLANRLTQESGTDGQGKSYQKTYTLDAAGNRLASSFTLDGQLQAQTAYAYNSLDWLTATSVQSAGGTSNTSYGYDANGAQISQTSASGTQASVWDFEGHLQAQGQVDGSGNWNGARSSYSYDASGMRLSQAAFNATGTLTGATSYVWNGDRVAEERDQNGVLQAVYEHGQELGPLRLRRLKDGNWQNRFFIGDGQDSTRQLMNEAGVVTDSYFYDAFGNALNGGQGVTTNSFKYTGQQQDSNGLYYLRARYYNAGTGRFLSQDPEMGHSDDPISMHRYLYTGADPINGVDPSGRDTLGNVCMSMAIGGILGSIGNGVAQYALTGKWSAQAFQNGFLGGAAAGGILAVAPVLSGVAALVGVYQTGLLIGNVFNNPNATAGQKVAALGLFATAVTGLMAAKYPTLLASLGAAAMGRLGGALVKAANAFSAFKEAIQSGAEEDYMTFSSPMDELDAPMSECFVKGTKVTVKGYKLKDINLVKVGDLILSKNPKDGMVAWKRVLRVFQKQVPLVLSIAFIPSDSLRCTLDHPFFVSKKGITKAKDLRKGDVMISSNGKRVVIKYISTIRSKSIVYNMEVQDFHTYFVGKDHVWVHNICRGAANNIAMAIGRIPSSAKIVDRFVVGPSDPFTEPRVNGEAMNALRNSGKYVNHEDPDHWGRFWVYEIPGVGRKVIAEHFFNQSKPEDVAAGAPPYYWNPHFHAGGPKGDPATYDFRTGNYAKIDGPGGDHHVQYDSNGSDSLFSP